jgi:hypothetical protein
MAVGSEPLLQLSLPPGSALTDANIIQSNHLQQAYFAAPAAGGKAKRF